VAIEYWHHHLGVSVPNLDEAIAWYERVLGFELERRIRIESIPADVAIIRNGPARIELFEAENAAPLPEGRRMPDEDIRTHGNKHASFACSDVVALADELRARGADIVWVKEFGDGRANCFLRDNAGNLIEFVQASAEPAGHCSLR
jgi:methylmalonyl-CoA/ethylmalonyl-CoA epimerase